MNNNKSEKSIEKQLDWSKACHVWRIEGGKIIREFIVPKKSADDKKHRNRLNGTKSSK